MHLTYHHFAVLSMAGIAALVVILAATARWFWRAYRVDIPASPRLFVAAWAAGLVLALLGWTRGGANTAAAWGIGVALLMLYLAATGRQRVGSTAIKVGDIVPAFTAVDEHGAQFDSASLAGSRFLLKFFRGHW